MVRLTLALLAVVLLVDGAWTVTRLKSDLETVATGLEELPEELGQGRLGTAEAGAREALEASRSAVGAGRRPSFVVASLVPGVKQEVRIVLEMARASEKTALAAGSAVQAARSLGLDEEGVPEHLYSDGQVKLETALAVRDELNKAERSLTEAQIQLQGLTPRLSTLRNSLDQARDRVGRALARAADARTTLDLLHPMLGGEGKRKYLLAFQAIGESRGTGGVVGVAGVLSAEEGRTRLGPIRPYTDIVDKPFVGVRAPSWFRQSYGSQSALTQWTQANLSPNYPVVSAVFLDMYEQQTGTRLDGVFAMDPITLSHLMAGMAPIETSTPPVTVDATNIAETLLLRSYTRFDDPEAQNVFLEQVVRGFWNRIESGDLDLKEFSKGLGEAIRTQHLKIYSREASEQTHIAELGLDGHYGSAAQMAFNVNYAANKIDYFLNREIDTNVELQADGTANVTTTITLHNQAPDGPTSLLLGQQPDLAPGVNRMTTNLLVPPGSVIESLTVGGEEREPMTYIDESSPVVWDLLEIKPGTGQTVEVNYSIPGALQLFEGGTLFEFTLFPQTTVNPDTYSLTVTAAPGTRITSPGGLAPDGSLHLSGVLDAPLPLRVQLSSE